MSVSSVAAETPAAPLAISSPPPQPPPELRAVGPFEDDEAAAAPRAGLFAAQPGVEAPACGWADRVEARG